MNIFLMFFFLLITASPPRIHGFGKDPHRPKLSRDPYYLQSASSKGMTEQQAHDQNCILGRLFGVRVAEKIDSLTKANNLSMLNTLAKAVITGFGCITKLPSCNRSVVLHEPDVTHAARETFPYKMARDASGKNNPNTLICSECHESVTNRTQAMLNHPCGRGRILSKIVESKEYAVVVMRSLLSDMKKPKNPMKLKIKEPAVPACQFTVRICYPKRCKKMVTESTLAIASNLPTALRPDGKDLVVMPAGAPGTGPVVKKAGRGSRQAGAGQAVVMGKGKKS